MARTIDKLDDARGVITGPMWAREEAARRNDEALRDLWHMLRWGLLAALLVLGAYALAACLDDATVAEATVAGTDQAPLAAHEPAAEGR